MNVLGLYHFRSRSFVPFEYPLSVPFCTFSFNGFSNEEKYGFHLLVFRASVFIDG